MSLSDGCDALTQQRWQRLSKQVMDSDAEVAAVRREVVRLRELRKLQLQQRSSNSLQPNFAQPAPPNARSTPHSVSRIDSRGMEDAIGLSRSSSTTSVNSLPTRGTNPFETSRASSRNPFTDADDDDDQQSPSLLGNESQLFGV